MIASGYVKYHDDLEHQMVLIDMVSQHPDNANNGDVDEIIESIEINGMYHPITVQKSTGYIVEGNHTWLACKELQATHIPITAIDVDDTTALRILMGDNKIAALARLDRGQELVNLRRLQETDQLRGTGYKDADIDHLAALSAKPLTSDDFVQPWKLMCFQVPRDTEASFMELTETAGGMKERFEMLLRMAKESR